MTQSAAALSSARSRRRSSKIGRPSGATWRWLALATIVGVALTSGDTARVVLESMSEAYLAVTVFVAGTLALLYSLEAGFRADIGLLLARHRNWQVPVAALLGAFPGCGGAIVAVTQYSRGYLSFGGLVATLTATMGDAMFLLLAKEPATGAMILLLSVAIGTVSGYVIDAIHGGDFLRAATPTPEKRSCETAAPDKDGRPYRVLRFAWLLLIVPGMAIGLLAAFQIETDGLFGPLAGLEPSLWIGVIGAAVALAMWARDGSPSLGNDTAACRARQRGSLTRVIGDTNFITSWVVFAFLAYELTVHLSGFDLGAFFQLWGPLVPLMAVAVGLLPGCGPQIVVTSLYLTGSLPLSAQIGNAISNDGDALFPAIALAPKAALVATLYSTIPALIVAYGTYALWE